MLNKAIVFYSQWKGSTHYKTHLHVCP